MVGERERGGGGGWREKSEKRERKEGTDKVRSGRETRL